MGIKHCDTDDYADDMLKLFISVHIHSGFDEGFDEAVADKLKHALHRLNSFKIALPADVLMFLPILTKNR